MKKRVLLVTMALLLAFTAFGCGKAETPQSNRTPLENSAESSSPDSTSAGGAESSAPESTPHQTQKDTMYILIGKHALTVKMADNSSAEALLALLEAGDITVNARDYGNFEKVGPLGTKLPTNDTQITTQPGDVILYQGDQITVYYNTNSWSFTQLGKVQGLTADELKAILGEGDVTMVLSLNAPSAP